MDTSGEFFGISEQTSNCKQFENIDELKKLYNLSSTNSDTSASGELLERKVHKVNEMAKNIAKFPLNYSPLFPALLLGVYFVTQSIHSDYRIDHSPTIDFKSDYQLELSNEKPGYHDNYIDDQPNYSHNEAYTEAKELGLSINFGL